MNFLFLYQINYIAVIATAFIVLFLGSFLFATLLGKTWAQQLEKHHVKIAMPTKNKLLLNMLLTLCANIVICFALACLVVATNSTTIVSGLILGVTCAIGFAVTTLALITIWENRPLKLFLIDTVSPALAIIVAAVVLSLWR